MNIQKSEALYLRAKIEYYEGTPIMDDPEFDALEKMLKESGSKVHEQVGSKRKDFDFAHPTRMLSLAKIQTEKGDYKLDEFAQWLAKKALQLKTPVEMVLLSASPKFDGSAINIIYRDGTLDLILTRGDGKFGKNITKRLKNKIPNNIEVSGVAEIRCEVVIDTDVFEKKYSTEFANARNFVAGVLGKDDFDKEKINDLTLMPLHFIHDGVHSTDLELYLKGYSDYSHNIWDRNFSYESYINLVKEFEEVRKTLNFQLDGVVFSFAVDLREELGQNDHHPYWAIAIKYISEETVTEVVGIEWNIGKRGQFTPVVLLKPVQLAGTIVKRASGYNAGYVLNNRIHPGAIVSLRKSGDIIPEILNVIYSPE